MSAKIVNKPDTETVRRIRQEEKRKLASYHRAQEAKRTAQAQKFLNEANPFRALLEGE